AHILAIKHPPRVGFHAKHLSNSTAGFRARMGNLHLDFLFNLKWHLRGYLTLGIFTMLPFAFGSFGSFTTVTNNSFSPSPKATFVVPSPAAISNTCTSLPSGDIFKILPPNHWAT